MKTLRSQRLEIFVTMCLILMGLSCIAYSTWSWAGADAWCHRDKTQVNVSGTVAWGGMSSGSWSVSASVGGETPPTKTGSCTNSGAWYRHLTAIHMGKKVSGSASCSIGGTGTDGKMYMDSDADSI